MSLIRVDYHGREWKHLDLALRLGDHIMSSGKQRGARRAFDECGLVICCDEAWFPPEGETTYRLSAADLDWQVSINFLKNRVKGELPPDRGAGGQAVLTRLVTFQGQQRKFVRAEVTNNPAFEKGLTLLRMFGPEELFSGIGV